MPGLQLRSGGGMRLFGATLVAAAAGAAFLGAPALRANAALPVGASLAPALPVTPVGHSLAHKLGDLAGKKATVLLFVSTNCPITNSYAPEIEAFAHAYKSRGVSVVRVYSNAGIDAKTIGEHTKAYGLADLPALIDPMQKLADKLGATVTPQAFVLDGSLEVRYAGRIDDRFVDRGQARTTGASTHDVRAALDAVLAGKPVTAAETRAVGCSIERGTNPAPVAVSVVPTYAHDIAPILQQNCESCHRAGEIGPMPLETFDQAKKIAANLVSVTATRQMPPWKPVPGCGDFVGVRRLTDEQIATLKAWNDAGTPSGDLSKTPPSPVFTKGWTLGKPDLVLTMPTTWHTAADSPEVYRCFVLPTNLPEDKQVVAVEYRPGNRSVVHHVLAFLDTSGAGRAKEGVDGKPGYTSFGGPGFAPTGELGGWAPGMLPAFLPDGIARPLPKGADVVIQVHYHPTGKEEDDKTQIGIYFAKKPITKKLRTLPIVARVNIPAGDANWSTSQTFKSPLDAEIISVIPHMHLLGKKISMTVTMPDGTVTPLIKIDDWDFNWQGIYTFKTPIHMPKGAVLTLNASYDNSAANPRNPHNPPIPVKWGEATTDEMCIGFVSFVPTNEADPIVAMLDRIMTGPGAGKRAAAIRARLAE